MTAHKQRRDHTADRAGSGGGRGDEQTTPAFRWLGQAIGHTRFVVLIAVIAVLMIAISLFVLGAVEAVSTVWSAWIATVQGGQPASLSVEFLEIVIIMLEAVVFFLIGVGLYSLFIAPLNLAIALGVETLNDLEERVISVVVAVLAITFLQHFILWQEPRETLQFGGALALTVISLVLFQRYSHRAKEDQKQHKPDKQQRSRREMFEGDQERHRLKPDEAERIRRAERPDNGESENESDRER